MSGNNRRWNRSYPVGSGGSYFSVIDQYLKDHGIRRKSIPKDGCCLFRAVADQVYLTQTSHWDLRWMCANYIRQNHTKFHSFMTVSFDDYYWKLAHCNLWGGEMELVALAELLERDIHVYHEQDDRVKIKKFTPKDTPSKLPNVMLLFSGNNHYDSLWRSTEESAASFCQSILYELLLESVMGMKMDQRDLSKAINLRGYDFSQRSGPSNQYLLDKYPHDLLRGLSSLSFFNVPYKVYKRDKESCEKADRKLAVSLQFVIGDKVQVNYEGSQYTGDVLSGIKSNNMVEIFVEDIRKRIKVPLSDVRLLQQRKSRYSHSNKTSSTRTGRSNKSSNNVNGENTTAAHTPRRSYLKNGSKARASMEKKQQQQQQQDNVAATATTSSTVHVHQSSIVQQQSTIVLPDQPLHPNGVQHQEQVSLPIPAPKIIPLHCVENELYILDDQQQSSSVGFSEATVRMSSLMGRPLEIFNQTSMASVNEAPESEWPILNAGSLRNRLTTVMAGSNPQRCHLDGPPPPPPATVEQLQQLPFITTAPPTGTSLDNLLCEIDPMKLLIKEMDPPLHLLKTGSSEGRQHFMFEFAQNCLRFYSKYISDPELEDSLSDLLCMEFDDFIAPPPQYTQRDFSIATSLTSREGSQMDINSDNTTAESERNTPRTSDAHNSSDTVSSPVEQPTCNGHVIEATPPTYNQVVLSSLPNDATMKDETVEPVVGVVSPSLEDGTVPTEGAVPPTVMNGSPYAFVYPPHGPPPPHSPYGYPPYPLVVPSHMFPWTAFYHPAMANPYMMPMMQPQLVRPQSSPTEEEEEDVPVDGRTSSTSSDSSNSGVAESLQKLPINDISGDQSDHNEQVIERATTPPMKKHQEEVVHATVNEEPSESKGEESKNKSITVKKQDSSSNEDVMIKSSNKSHQSRSFVRAGSGSNQQNSGGRNRHHYNRQQQNSYRNNYNGGRNRHNYSYSSKHHDQQQRRKNKDEGNQLQQGNKETKDVQKEQQHTT